MLGYDLAKLCFEGPAEELDSTVHSQPALFVTSLAALELLREQSPDIVLACEAAAGLSLGEYTAMVFAGIMDFEEGLMTVQRRGAAMQEAADATAGGMVTIIGLERAQVEALCQQARQDEVLEIANLLAPDVCAVSGTNQRLFAGGRAGDEDGRDEGRSAGGRRGLSHGDHASGRPAHAPRPWPKSRCVRRKSR